jgi:hypothetical protein
MENGSKRLDKIIRHIKHVQESCQLLGEKLIDRGEFEFGKNLIANGFIHDHSKFFGIEWEHLNGIETEAGRLALQQHQAVNMHHPEYWGGIEKVPRIYLAECVADWFCRSAEFGTSLRDWIKNVAMKKYNIPVNSKTHKEIKYFVDLLLEDVFN